ncbi:MAG: hypothetical protein JXR19_09470 [Bacteroidia bacterium]
MGRSSWFCVLIGTFILSFGAFFNWFPFFTGDTAVYLNAGFENYVPSERPVFYGWFLRFSALGFSLWLPALLQSFLLSFLLVKLIEIIWPKANNNFKLLSLLLIGIVSGVWWESTKLIPDPFVAIMSLSLLVLTVGKVTKSQHWLLWIFVLISTMMHLSHLALLLGFLLVILVFNPFHKRQKKLVIPLVVIALLSFLGLGLSNLVLEDQFQLAKGNKVFLLGKLNESGVLDIYLEEECSERDLVLCEYKDSLPATAWQFVWDPHGAVMKTGGWEVNREEHARIVKDILTSPKYWPILSYKAIMATAVQLVQYNVGDNLFRQEKGSNSVSSIDRYFPHETNAALWTKQFLMELPFSSMSWYYLLTLLLSIAWLIYYSAKGDLKKGYKEILVILLLLIVLNAFFTANLANISSRLNARMLWLLPALISVIWLKNRTAINDEHSKS